VYSFHLPMAKTGRCDLSFKKNEEFPKTARRVL